MTVLEIPLHSTAGPRLERASPGWTTVPEPLGIPGNAGTIGAGSPVEAEPPRIATVIFPRAYRIETLVVVLHPVHDSSFIANPRAPLTDTARP